MYHTHKEDPSFEIRMTPSSPLVLEGTKNKLYLLFEIQVEEKKESNPTSSTRKNPFNLALVLDRSGSMTGQKIEFAKQAVEEVIGNLRPQDTLHFVIYDNNVDTVFEKGDLQQKRLLQQKIKQISVGNTTYLSGGLQRGADLVQKYLSKDKTNRVFIFSDGLANVGLRTLPELSNLALQIHKAGIGISSFGIGTDFNEEIMQNLAEQGRGDYFFIDQADTIPNIVDEAIDGLLGLVLTNVEVKFASEKGVDIKKIYAYDKAVVLGDVRETETRQVLLELEIDPAVAESNKILSFSLQYRTIDAIMEDKSISDIIGIPYTRNEAEMGEENEEVLLAKHLLETAEKEKEIANLLQQFEYDRAEQVQLDLVTFLKSLNLRDKDGLLADKISFLEKIRERMLQRDYLQSHKMSHYSSYQTMSSKKRAMMSSSEQIRRAEKKNKEKKD